MDRFIKLIVDKPLEAADIRAWFNTVIENGPSGVVNAVAVDDDDGNRHVVRLIHQAMASKRHAYVIPTMRDLTADEITHIVEQFAKQRPQLDFDVEVNTTRLRARDHDVIPLETSKHLALCTALAKHKHEDWVRERSSAGWRYGVRFDADEKVHPLLRPWDQLPERYRLPDMTAPQQLVDLLNSIGYIIIPKNEIDEVGQR